VAAKEPKREFKLGDKVRVNLHHGKIEDAVVKAVIQDDDGIIKLQVDVGENATIGKQYRGEQPDQACPEQEQRVRFRSRDSLFKPQVVVRLDRSVRNHSSASVRVTGPTHQCLLGNCENLDHVQIAWNERYGRGKLERRQNRFCEFGANAAHWLYGYRLARA